MGQSCLYFSENIDALHIAMDNLLIAKKLFDLGMQLPQNYVFTIDRVSNRYDSFFLFGLEILTGCEANVLQDYGDEYSFILEIPEAMKWKEIETKFPNAAKERCWIIDPFENETQYSEYSDAFVEMEFQPGIGFLFQVYEIGIFFSIFERFCECYFRLKQKIVEWDGWEENGHVGTTEKWDNHSDS